MSNRTPPFSSYPLWTEARFWQYIRSGLRKMSMRWPPKNEAKKLARRKYVGDNPRMKWEYQCARCGGWFADKNVEVHHKHDVGELKKPDDLPGFVMRLFCGVDGFEVLCSSGKESCHYKETHGA